MEERGWPEPKMVCSFCTVALQDVCPICASWTFDLKHAYSYCQQTVPALRVPGVLPGSPCCALTGMERGFHVSRLQTPHPSHIGRLDQGCV